MITDPFFYLCAVPAVLLFGLAKGGFGGGVALLAVPLMALAVPPLQAAAILLPLLIVMDFTAVWSFCRRWDKTSLQILIPAAILGTVVGAFTFHYLSEDAIRILIALIALAFSLNYYTKLLLKRPLKTKEANPVAGGFWGIITGFTSFGIHAGGPPLSVYLLPLRLEKTILMGTFAVFFMAINLIKLVPYAWLGQFDTSTLITSLVLLPLAPIGVRLGYYLLHKVSENFIYEISYFFLVVIGVKLMMEGIGGLAEG